VLLLQRLVGLGLAVALDGSETRGHEVGLLLGPDLVEHVAEWGLVLQLVDQRLVFCDHFRVLHIHKGVVLILFEFQKFVRQGVIEVLEQEQQVAEAVVAYEHFFGGQQILEDASESRKFGDFVFDAHFDSLQLVIEGLFILKYDQLEVALFYVEELVFRQNQVGPEPLIESALVEQLLEHMRLKVVLNGLLLVASRFGNIVLDQLQIFLFFSFFILWKHLVQFHVLTGSLFSNFFGLEFFQLVELALGDVGHAFDQEFVPVEFGAFVEEIDALSFEGNEPADLVVVEVEDFVEWNRPDPDVVDLDVLVAVQAVVGHETRDSHLHHPKALRYLLLLQLRVVRQVRILLHFVTRYSCHLQIETYNKCFA